MKVYVVMSGCIDDCFPVDIFKTENLANEWVEIQTPRYLPRETCAV